MAIINEYPYVTLRTLKDISDEEFLQLSNGDIRIMELRELQDADLGYKKIKNYYPFTSVERRELLENLTPEQFFEAAKESIMKPENGQGNFFQSTCLTLKLKSDLKRLIAEGKYDGYMDEASLQMSEVEKDLKNLVRYGVSAEATYYDKTPDGYKGDHAQWRRDLVGKNK